MDHITVMVVNRSLPTEVLTKSEYFQFKYEKRRGICKVKEFLEAPKVCLRSSSNAALENPYFRIESHREISELVELHYLFVLVSYISLSQTRLN